jgi:mono/diheme cytochrome c family protein
MRFLEGNLSPLHIFNRGLPQSVALTTQPIRQYFFFMDCCGKKSFFGGYRWLGIALAVALLVALASCGENKNDSVSPNPPQPQPKVEILSNYKSIYESILGPKCVSCHSGASAPHGIDLSSYKNIMENALFPPLVVSGRPDASSLYSAVASGEMPKNGAKLSENELLAIYKWIELGAPEFEGSQPSPTPQPTEPPDFN